MENTEKADMSFRHILILTLVACLVPCVAVAQESKATKGAADPVQDWVKVLVARMDSKNETVRTSVGRALVSVGKPALPALQKVGKGNDAKKAGAAKRIIAQIENPRRNRGGQGGRFGGNRRDPFAGMKLTDEQKGKADKAMAANREARTQLFADMRNGEMDRSEMREATQELTEKLNQKLKGILTAEQMKKYQENTSRRRGGRRGRRGSDG